MTLKVIGAGLGRTGTMSLKMALERLLGEPCYHMAEVISRPEHVAIWDAALQGQLPDWSRVFDGYGAAVDWPAVTFWEEISAAYPDALILLSTRDPQQWWRSANETIFVITRRVRGPWRQMADQMFARFTPDIGDEAACIDAFERHYCHVRATAPRERLLEWQPSDGWAPLAAALGVEVPDEPFPRTNTREEYAAALERMPDGIEF